MKWNLQSNSWEVSLRLHPQDLERALSAERSQEKPNERVSVDDDGFSDLATKYLGTRFFVRRTPHAVNAAEPSVQPELHKLWFVHRILLDTVERQENTVAIDPTRAEKYSLQFRSGLEFQEMKPKSKQLTVKSSIPQGLESP